MRTLFFVFAFASLTAHAAPIEGVYSCVSLNEKNPIPVKLVVKKVGNTFAIEMGEIKVQADIVHMKKISEEEVQFRLNDENNEAYLVCAPVQI